MDWEQLVSHPHVNTVVKRSEKEIFLILVYSHFWGVVMGVAWAFWIGFCLIFITSIIEGGFISAKASYYIIGILFLLIWPSYTAYLLAQ